MRTLFYLCCLVAAACGVMACSNDAPPQDAAIVNREKLPIMVSHGVSKLISDSGINRYKVITEEWAIYDKTTPPRQDFLKGILLLRFDNKMKVDMQITADTAYWYDLIAANSSIGICARMSSTPMYGCASSLLSATSKAIASRATRT